MISLRSVVLPCTVVLFASACMGPTLDIESSSSGGTAPDLGSLSDAGPNDVTTADASPPMPPPDAATADSTPPHWNVETFPMTSTYPDSLWAVWGSGPTD